MSREQESGGKRVRRRKVLTRKILLSVLPKADGKPIDTLTAHIRVRRQGPRVKQINVAVMLRNLAAAGLVEKSKVGRWNVWRKFANSPPPIKRNRLRHSEVMRAHWADPEYRAKHARGMHRALLDPRARANTMEAQRRRSIDSEACAKQADAMRRRWADPEIRTQIMEAMRRSSTTRTPEARVKRAEAQQRRWTDPEARAKQSAAQKARHARARAQKAEREKARQLNRHRKEP